MTLPVKRTIYEEERETANCLMQLSKLGEDGGDAVVVPSLPSKRSFECKTCNRKFSSFQALGGHRASHKRPRVGGESDAAEAKSPPPPPKPKTHECPMCGLDCPTGQALGGHMRRHRAELESRNRKINSKSSEESSIATESTSSSENGMSKKQKCMIFGVDFMSLVEVEPENHALTKMGLEMMTMDPSKKSFPTLLRV